MYSPEGGVSSIGLGKGLLLAKLVSNIGETVAIPFSCLSSALNIKQKMTIMY
jgi:hypothetical protein